MGLTKRQPFATHVRQGFAHDLPCASSATPAALRKGGDFPCHVRRAEKLTGGLLARLAVPALFETILAKPKCLISLVPRGGIEPQHRDFKHDFPILPSFAVVRQFTENALNNAICVASHRRRVALDHTAPMGMHRSTGSVNLPTHRSERLRGRGRFSGGGLDRDEFACHRTSFALLPADQPGTRSAITEA
jgi:hypothetical protein